MPQVSLHQISECCHLLKNANPRVYERLLRLLDAWTDEVTVAVTEAPSTDILQLQGRAQQARKTLQVFVETREPKEPLPL
jgi:hypothetical protein